MPTTITMPQLGETVTEGTVAQWLKNVGDSVEKYEAFVEVSTDKVNAEVPSPVSGTIRELIVGEGETVPTGAPIAIIDEVAAAADRPAADPAPAAQPAGAIAHGAGRRAAARAAVPLADRQNGKPRAARTARCAAPPRRCAGWRASTPIDVSVLAAPAPAAASPRATSWQPRRADRRHPHKPERLLRRPPRSAPAPASRPALAVPVPGGLAAAHPGAPHHRAADGRVEANRAACLDDGRSRRHQPLGLAQREKDAFERAHGVKLTLLPFFMRAVVEALRGVPAHERIVHARRASRFTTTSTSESRSRSTATCSCPVIRGADGLSIRGLALAAGELIDARAARPARRRRLERRNVHRQQHRRERLDPLGTDPGYRPSRHRHDGSGRQAPGRDATTTRSRSAR